MTKTIKNQYGSFSTLDDNPRSLTGSSSYGGLYVAKLSLFSGLKMKKIKKVDAIVNIDGKVLKKARMIGKTAINQTNYVIRAQRCLN